MKLSSVLKLAAAAATVFGSSAFAGTVGGTVAPINTLSNEVDVSNITIVAAVGQTDTTIVTAQIDNNNEGGWKLQVDSANHGKLLRGTGGAGREIAYTNVKLVKTGGTLGAGLTDPSGGNNSVTTGTTTFNTGTAVGTPGVATTATVGYAFALKISWNADTSLLSGSYTDTITLTLANDI